MRLTSKILIVVLTLFLCLQAASSYAWWEGRYHRHYWGHPYVGMSVSFLSDAYTPVWIDGTRYYYCDGYYYVPQAGGYVVVSPPTQIVTTIPSYYQPVVVNGVTYYVNNGIYYVYTPYGYQAVQPPVTVVTTQVVSAATTSTDEGSFTVNIPNDKGGYTPVILKRSGKGFTGPQGEFYAQFPKVVQLKAMYGK